ncbi:MAG: hypothetical protein RDU20_23030, partial [Desulfomonilaceae bacterium]|nr:hypothetical protein [Desulfomonilaceae bacterium]
MLEVRILLGLSYLVLFFYMNSFFFSIQFHGVPWIKSNTGRRLISLLISGSLAYLVSMTLTRVVPLTKP